MLPYRMAIELLKCSAGKSAVAAAAYGAGVRIKNERTGKVYDFRHKVGIEGSFILAPEMAPVWAVHREKLWNMVEAAERRKDAQFARQVLLNLPCELDYQQRKDLVFEFVRKHFVQEGMVADIAMHAPPTDGDPRNYHAHILLTLRSISEHGFGKKAREWNSKQRLKIWRQSWSEMQNIHLAAAGSDEYVDHRSLNERSREAFSNGDFDLAMQLDRPPEPKMGVEVCAKEARLRKQSEQRGQTYVPVTRLAQEVTFIRNCRHIVEGGSAIVKQKEEQIRRIKMKLQTVQQCEQAHHQVIGVFPLNGELPSPEGSEILPETENTEINTVCDLESPTPS